MVDLLKEIRTICLTSSALTIIFLKLQPTLIILNYLLIYMVWAAFRQILIWRSLQSLGEMILRTTSLIKWWSSKSHIPRLMMIRIMRIFKESLTPWLFWKWGQVIHKQSIYHWKKLISNYHQKITFRFLKMERIVLEDAECIRLTPSRLNLHSYLPTFIRSHNDYNISSEKLNPINLF